MTAIIDILGREILDSRGNPTVEVDVLLEDGSLTLNFLAGASDIDGDALTATPGTPQHGSLEKNADGSYTYRPAADYNGAEGFAFAVSDGQAETQARVRLTITAVNDAPVARNDLATLAEEDLDLIKDIFWHGKTERELAPLLGYKQSKSVNKRKHKILETLRQNEALKGFFE